MFAYFHSLSYFRCDLCKINIAKVFLFHILSITRNLPAKTFKKLNFRMKLSDKKVFENQFARTFSSSKLQMQNKCLFLKDEFLHSHFFSKIVLIKGVNFTLFPFLQIILKFLGSLAFSLQVSSS